MTTASLKKISILLLFLVPLFLAAQKKTWPNTLLWRITGNGLTKSSYLYGTMHLQDKRLFNFGDSIYNAIERCEGLALEVNFNEIMDSMFRRNADKVLKDEFIKIDKKKFGRSADSLLKKLGYKEDKLTKKQLKEIRDYRINNLSSNNEMTTIVDGYLYNMASRMGKWLGGIEDVTDQLDLMDEIGADVTPEEVFQSDDKLRMSMNRLTGMYIDQDLQDIGDQSYGGADKEFTDKILINRNIKMARRMDSLSRIRSMFFAVGAAHLPGDSGVITFLRNKGFQVEPVYSSKKIPAETYSKKLADVPWKTITDENKLYTIELPGNPFDYDGFGEALKMKIYFDISNMTFYMTGNAIGSYKSEKDIQLAVDNMVKKISGSNGKVTEEKKISKDGFEGLEVLAEGITVAYKVRILQKNNIIYLLMMGSSKKSNISQADANHFFESLKGLETKGNNEWVKFDVPGKAFTVSLPSLPKKNKLMEERAEKTNFKFTAYDLSDMTRQIYFLVQVRDVKGGYFLNGDSAFFSELKETFKKNVDKLERDTFFTLKGFPALRFDGAIEKQNARLKCLSILRNNRVYILMAAGTPSMDSASTELFFNSIKFTDYTESNWKLHSGPGFTTTATAPFEEFKSLDTSVKETFNGIHSFSLDTIQDVSYDVMKSLFPKYYWANNDSIYYEQKVKELSGDSIINKETCYTGKLKGIDIVYHNPDISSLKKVRIFVNGDTLYTITAHVPPGNDKSYEKFFNNFTLVREIQPTVFTNKWKQITEAFSSKDSADFADALTSFKQLELKKEDLPYLHKAMLEKYQDLDSNDYGLNYYIINAISTINDPSTIEFIKDNYQAITPDKDKIKYQMLILLAKAKTKESYALLKEYLNSSIPYKGQSGELRIALMDSLPLTRQLFPGILKQLTDSSFSNLLVWVTNRLIDSNMLSLTDIQPYQQLLFSQLKLKLANAHTIEEEDYLHRQWINLLEKINNKESNQLLQQYLRVNSVQLQRSAILALFKNHQPVESKAIEKVASDKGYRLIFYNDLEKIKKVVLFPLKYKTQKSLAESNLYSSLEDDNATVQMTYAGEQIALFNGKKQKFYLYKMIYENGSDTTEEYLGVSGAYNLAPADLKTDGEATGVYKEEYFNKGQMAKQLRTYLKHLENNK